jgi:hypothetical protein
MAVAVERVIIIIIIISLTFATGPFSQVLLLSKQRRSRTAQAAGFRLQYFQCCVLFHVQLSLCTEYIECFPGVDFKFFFKAAVAIMVAPVVNCYNHTFHVPHSLQLYTRTPYF